MLKNYDCIIIGGGIAGLQAAIQLGRYKHNILVIDSGHGRSSICRGYHNILGWPDGVSGNELRELGKRHAEKYGVEFIKDKAIKLETHKDYFTVIAEHLGTFQTKTVFLATGLVDRLPQLENLSPCLGRSVYVCPDCDGYEVADKKTLVLGGGNTGAEAALTLTYFTGDIVFINHDQKQMDDGLEIKLKKNGIPIIWKKIAKVLIDDEENFNGVTLEDGETILAERGFTGFSGNKMNNELAIQAGVQLNESQHIATNPRTKETSVTGIWSGGDLIAHSEQVTISMGDGSQAAIWIHKRLMGEKRIEE
ncbi:NAD(P)/FAD-dependent oxidoreductase [Peribacillus sp. B-H-3]|uniref:NAD(P)/FAD-dependent oxidoreductase n=1 Tax=Peribacillus sp. B-H-3 TaxID=3400420 RepID=UPI003B02D633